MLKQISSGLSISICAIAAAFICAIAFPIGDDSADNLLKEPVYSRCHRLCRWRYPDREIREIQSPICCYSQA